LSVLVAVDLPNHGVTISTLQGFYTVLAVRGKAVVPKGCGDNGDDFALVGAAIPNAFVRNARSKLWRCVRAHGFV
jgi:hypothetical protein